MKRIAFLLALVLTMLSSITAGTMAMYNVALDNMSEGSVVAKEFIFLSEGMDTFQKGIKIAPSETVRWQFKVKNYENHVVSETNMYYQLTFNVVPSTGKMAIEPLMVTLKDLEGNVLNQVRGIGSMEILDVFLLSETGQEKDYVVEIYWPETGKNNSKYAGGKYGTSITVDALASQIPIESSTGGSSQDGKEHSVSVLYQTTKSWPVGNEQNFEYKVTITNNSNEPINDWYASFTLPNDRIIKAWSNAILVSDSPDGYYQFVNPNYNNEKTDSILPGQSVTFGGLAKGLGNEPIENVTVGGKYFARTNIQLTCKFNQDSLNN